jgi:hypothetical protein
MMLPMIGEFPVMEVTKVGKDRLPENGVGILDKGATSHDDLFDSFRLSLHLALIGLILLWR